MSFARWKMKRWAAVCGLAIIVIVLLADTRHLGFLHAVYDIPFGDKVGHFVLFGLLSLSVNLAVFEARPAGNRIRLAAATSAILALLIGMEEFSQRWIRSRTFSLLDLTASYLGVAFFAWLAIKWEKRKPSNALKPEQ